MDIEFIGKDWNYWGGDRPDFDIIYDGREDISKYVKEFRLNCKNQLM